MCSFILVDSHMYVTSSKAFLYLMLSYVFIIIYNKKWCTAQVVKYLINTGKYLTIFGKTTG